MFRNRDSLVIRYNIDEKGPESEKEAQHEDKLKMHVWEKVILLSCFLMS